MLEKFSQLVDGLDHPEGVACGPDGGVFAGGEAGQIYRVSFEGTAVEVANTKGFILGLALDGDANIYACDLKRSEVLRVRPSTGGVDVYSSGAADEPMRTPNYPAFADDGSLFVTDSGKWEADDGCVFSISPAGQTSVWTRITNKFPNGCCLSPEGDALYVVESLRPGLARIPILSDGSAGDPELVVELPETVPDGVAMGAEGNLYVSCYRPDRIYRITPRGDPEILAEDPRGTTLSAPTNVAFVGPNRDRLVVASLGRWHLMIGDVGERGVELRYPSLS